MRSRLTFIAAAFCSLVISVPCYALTITPTFIGGTADQKAAVNAAILDWDFLLSDPVGKSVSLAITFEFKVLTLGNGGNTTLFTPDANDLPMTSAIELSTNTDMFWDSTLGTDNDIPVDKKDGYTVARHEIAHALGFGEPWTKWDACTTGTSFSCNSVTATLAGTTTNGQSHLSATSHAGDLMNLTVGLGNRRSPSTKDVDMMIAAFSYTPEPSTAFLLASGLVVLAAKRRRM